MTRGEIIIDLKSRIGSDPEVSDSRLIDWVNEGLRIFCAEHDYYWLQKRVTTSTFADQAEYTMPTDFKSIIEVRIDPTDDDPNVYKYIPYQQRYGLGATEKAMTMVGNVLWVHPTPTTTTSNNVYLTYTRYPSNMDEDSDSPSDDDIAGMPEAFHPALIVYAFALYQGYDEEHGEMDQLMGSQRSPRPGTFYYFVNLAKREDEQIKKGVRRHMLSKQEAIGYTKPNQIGIVSEVLKI